MSNIKYIDKLYLNKDIEGLENELKNLNKIIARYQNEFLIGVLLDERMKKRNLEIIEENQRKKDIIVEYLYKLLEEEKNNKTNST